MPNLVRREQDYSQFADISPIYKESKIIKLKIG